MVSWCIKHVIRVCPAPFPPYHLGAPPRMGFAARLLNLGVLQHRAMVDTSSMRYNERYRCGDTTITSSARVAPSIPRSHSSRGAKTRPVYPTRALTLRHNRGWPHHGAADCELVWEHACRAGGDGQGCEWLYGCLTALDATDGEGNRSRQMPDCSSVWRSCLALSQVTGHDLLATYAGSAWCSASRVQTSHIR